MENGGRRGSRDTPGVKTHPLLGVLSAGPRRAVCPPSFPPQPRYSPITPRAGSRSETAQGHSPAPPLRPAPPFRALKPCRISQRSGDCRGGNWGRGRGSAPPGSLQSEAFSPGGARS